MKREDMMRTRILVVLSVVVTIASCAAPEKKNHCPDWIDNPGDYIVGKCATHVKGKIAQERCAFENGLTYLAMSKGVSVDVSSQMTVKQTATEKTGKQYGQVESVVTVDEKNIKVSGTVVDKWHDRVSDIMYVLIEEN